MAKCWHQLPTGVKAMNIKLRRIEQILNFYDVRDPHATLAEIEKIVRGGTVEKPVATIDIYNKDIGELTPLGSRVEIWSSKSRVEPRHLIAANKALFSFFKVKFGCAECAE
jgi:hypothetical protein